MPDQYDPNETRRMDDAGGSAPYYPTEPFRESPGAYGGSQETIILKQEKPTFAWLVAVNGIRAGRLWTLSANQTALGRDAQNDIVLDDPAASRQHAKIKREAGEGEDKREQFYLYDLASGNGTFLNGDKVYRAPLKDGDKVRIGESDFIFKTLEEPKHE